jgi:hypothetical protein
LAQGLYDEGEILLLPQDDEISLEPRDGFVEFSVPISQGDSVIVLLGPLEAQVRAIYNTLRSLPKEELPTPVYRLDALGDVAAGTMTPPGLAPSHQCAMDRVLRFLLRQRRKEVRWQFVLGVSDPVGAGFERAVDMGCSSEDLGSATLEYARMFVGDYLRVNCLDPLGVDVLGQTFDPAAGWKIYEGENAKVLVYRSEDLVHSFGASMDCLLGLPDLRLDARSEPSLGERSGSMPASSFVLDRAALRNIYDSNFVRHFYTPAEIAAFYERWAG